jgi:hypothetical protein
VYDIYWGMPTENWLQQGSFLEAIPAPTGDPDTGTLYQLPCISQEYIPILLGALDQLRNPSTWDPTLTSAQLAQALDRVDQLRSLFSNAVNVPCCNVQMQLTTQCELQFSVDGGVTWQAVTNWDSQFPSCVRNNVVPPPTNPDNTLQDQYACNIAGFLASEAIQGSIQIAYNQFNISATLIQFATELLPFLEAVGFILTTAFADVALALYTYINNSNKTDFENAATDPTLKSLLTCAIFSAIRAAGKVTSGNFATILANIASISYAHAEVISAIHDYVAAMGEVGFASLQNLGAVADEDCSSCSTNWCHEIDLTVSNGGAVLESPGISGTWVSGSGWESAYYAGVGGQYLAIEFPVWPASSNIVSVALFLTSGAWSGGHTDARCWFYYLSGTLQGFINWTNYGAYATRTKILIAGVSSPGDRVGVQWLSDSPTPVVLSKIQYIGVGVNPFGADNCTE